MIMQFEAGNGVNILWGENAEMRIIASVKIIPDCSDDFGYLTMKRAILKRFPDMDFKFWYDGQEDYLEEDAAADVPVEIDMQEK